MEFCHLSVILVLSLNSPSSVTSEKILPKKITHKIFIESEKRSNFMAEEKRQKCHVRTYNVAASSMEFVKNLEIYIISTPDHSC